MASLPPFILSAWRLQTGEEGRAKKAQQLNEFTTSSLAEAMMEFQLHRYFDTSDRNVSAPSLVSCAVGSILKGLADLQHPALQVKKMAEDLNYVTLRQLLADPRTPYQLLRSFLKLPETMVARDRILVDVDEAVLQNEQYIRSRDSNRDGRYLVHLEGLSQILSEAPLDDRPLSFTRKDPPKGGLEILDELRKREMTIQPSSASYCKVFDRITHGILRGLDWSNVLVAGGMALVTLLHTDPSKDDDRRVRDPDIDLYIYGLGPEGANRKIKEIHDTWARNLPATAQQRLVVKNAKTINLFSSYPHRRIQIILKLLPSPTDVLLNFDLDACAICFDGSRVSMLPRCARAVETGYSVFTMDLIWGHHLSDRRASQEERIFKYAKRGFGLRILPSYAQSLQEDNLEATVFGDSQSPASAGTYSSDENNEGWSWSQRDRKPCGKSEHGLKTLKRIAYLGRDFVPRFYFGATPLAISQECYYRQRDLGDPRKAGAEHVIKEKNEKDWRKAFNKADLAYKEIREDRENRRTHNEPLDELVISLAELDTPEMYRGLPDGRKGFGNFEIFMRHCEAWRMDVLGEASLGGADGSASIAYDPASYDEFPAYDWDETFSIDDLEWEIQQCNNKIWENAKLAICEKLGIPLTHNGYRNFCTRRTRRLVYARDLAAVQRMQITIPVIVPWALEQYLFTKLPQQYGDIPSHFANFGPLIPLHDTSSYNPSTAVLPSLHDTSSESGNLRFWVITNESMWAHQHRVLDEIAELMWSLFHWFNQFSSHLRTAKVPPECKWRLARDFRRRIVLPGISARSSVTGRTGLPSLRETLLFRPWAFASPITVERYLPKDKEWMNHELFNDAWVLYPFPDRLFWHTSDEGTLFEREGVPSWTDPSVGDTEASVGDTEALVGDTEASVSDMEALVGDTEASVSDMEALMVDTEASVSDMEALMGDTEASGGDTEASVDDMEVD